MIKKKIYCVGNAHLDPAWMWKWQEGSAEAKATIRSALDRMKEFPDFKFVCAGVSVYEWIEEFDPEMFEEIKRRVAEGRFVLAGGWYVQPDCNLPSGEGFARQGLYSQRYFYKKFGKTAKTGYNVDSFGHNGNLPQILAKSGMENYIYMRPSQTEMPMESPLFWWTSADGSKVLTHRISFYCFRFEHMTTLKEELNHASDMTPKGTDCVPFFYGVGNHGGGPTIKNLELLHEFAKENPDKEIIYTDLQDFFTHLREQKDFEIPTFREDLQHHASGCYAAYSPIKTLVRKSERALVAAETYAAFSCRLLGRKFPLKKIEEGWKNVNFLHFHDILGGCCIKDAYPDAEVLGQESLAISVKITNNALQTLSWAIDTSDKSKGIPVVFFNPHPFAVKTTVQIGTQCTSVKDGKNDIPFQFVYSQTHLCQRRCDTLFHVELPPCGYKTYYVLRNLDGGFVSRNAPEVGRVAYAIADVFRDKQGLSCSTSHIEDDFFRVEFDKKDGTIARLFDKKNGRELLQPVSQKKGLFRKVRYERGALPIVIDERDHDTWSHAKNYFDKVVGKFGDARISVVESGSIRCEVKVVSSYGKSTLTQYFRLENDGLLKVRAKIDWHEKQKMLKLAFPLQLTETKALYEIPFGTIFRPTNGEEECGQTWIATIGKEGGVALLNNNKYSFSVKDNVMCLTAIRSPYFGDHGAPFVSSESEVTDQGESEFSYAITPFTSCGDITKKALLFNTAPSFVIENNHNGTLPDKFDGLSADCDNILVSCVKRAEEDNGWIVRAYETDGKETKVTLSGGLLPVALTAEFTPYSVNTYFLADDASAWKTVPMTEMPE